MTAFDIVPTFTRHYRRALLIAVHKNDKADAYTIFLYNNYEEVKDLITKTAMSLKFRPFE